MKFRLAKADSIHTGRGCDVASENGVANRGSLVVRNVELALERLTVLHRTLIAGFKRREVMVGGLAKNSIFVFVLLALPTTLVKNF